MSLYHCIDALSLSCCTVALERAFDIWQVTTTSGGYCDITQFARLCNSLVEKKKNIHKILKLVQLELEACLIVELPHLGKELKPIIVLSLGRGVADSAFSCGR